MNLKYIIPQQKKLIYNQIILDFADHLTKSQQQLRTMKMIFLIEATRKIVSQNICKARKITKFVSRELLKASGILPKLCTLQQINIFFDNINQDNLNYRPV